MEWILASASPRRKQLFGEIVETFEIIPATGEEDGRGLTGAKLVEALATQKAEEVAALPQAKNKGVLGADTIVCLDEKVLGKPKDAAEAEEMLSMLSGRTHSVYTGIAVLRGDDGTMRTHAEETLVTFRTLTKEEIRAYIETGEPMDKAGAYGIQGKGGALVSETEGDFQNVVGLPLGAVLRLMAEMNL